MISWQAGRLHTPARLLERLQLSHAQLPARVAERDLELQLGICTQTGCQLDRESCWTADLQSPGDFTILLPCCCRFLHSKEAQEQGARSG